MTCQNNVTFNTVSIINLKKESLMIKVGLSPWKKICFICFNENPSQMMKNAFYFNCKVFFVLKVSKF